jgi:hypothetical protein
MGVRILDPAQVVFGILVSGSTNTKTREFGLWNDLQWPSNFNAAVFHQLHLIATTIVHFAEDSCQTALDSIPPGSVISFDGSWEHRRNSRRCIITVFCQQTRKVIAFAITDTKQWPDNCPYKSSPQNLEVLGLREMLPVLRAKPEIIAYVHDNDAKTRKLILSYPPGCVPLVEHIDTGHALKSLDRALDKVRPCLTQKLTQGLRKWMKMLLYENTFSVEKKIAAWRNSWNHFMGIHDDCPFQHHQASGVLIDKEELRATVAKFLDDTSWILECCAPEYSTQVNESFNRSKLKYANKDVRWGFTWKARMACAILDRNCANWKMRLYHMLHLPTLSREAVGALKRIEGARLHLKFLSLTEGYQRTRKKMRDARRAADARQAQNESFYRGKPQST